MNSSIWSLEPPIPYHSRLQNQKSRIRPGYFFSFSFIALLTDFRPTLTLATVREYLSRAAVSIVTVSPAISSFKALVADAPPRCPFSGAFTLASRTGCLRLAVSNVSPSITLVTRSFLAIVLISTIQVHNHAQVKPLPQRSPPTQLSAVAVAQKARPTSQRCPISTRSADSSATNSRQCARSFRLAEAIRQILIAFSIEKPC